MSEPGCPWQHSFPSARLQLEPITLMRQENELSTTSKVSSQAVLSPSPDVPPLSRDCLSQVTYTSKKGLEMECPGL